MLNFLCWYIFIPYLSLLIIGVVTLPKTESNLYLALYPFSCMLQIVLFILAVIIHPKRTYLEQFPRMKSFWFNWWSPLCSLGLALLFSIPLYFTDSNAWRLVSLVIVLLVTKDGYDNFRDTKQELQKKNK